VSPGRPDDLHSLPPDLPVPVDDGACDHLPGAALPPVELSTTAGRRIRLDRLPGERTVIYAYPRTGMPDREPPGGLAAWDSIPGLRGCTPQACSYRDRHADLRRAGAEIFGLSTQTTAYQAEVAERLHLPFEVLSDAELVLTETLRLPTVEVAGHRVLRRFTMVIRGGRIERVFYPVFPPDADAPRVLAWLRDEAG
jgi:peroxiredoxin